MAEVGLTQLQMMLVRQGGFGTLPLSILPPTSFLSFIRTIEQLCLDEKLSPIIVYWAKHNASLLLPEGPRLKQLVSECQCVSVFSDSNQQAPDEWCIFIESNKLSLVIHGQATLDPVDGHRYQCAGSMDTELVKQSFNQLLPKFQVDDPSESNRLEEARTLITYGDSSVSLTQRLRSKWPIIKAPSMQSVFIPPQVLQAKAIPVSRQNNEAKVQHIPITNQTNLTISAKHKTINPPIQDFSPLKAAGAPGKMVSPDASQSIKNQTNTDEITIQRPIIHQLPIQAITAQSIITEIISRLRHSHNLNAILQFAIEKLTQAIKADRGLIWQVVGDQLMVTHEYAANGHLEFISNRLRQDESNALVLEFVNHFPDESAAGVISINDTVSDINLHKISPTLSDLIELGGVKARLMVQLRSRGLFCGFLELQQASATRKWNNDEAITIQAVAEMLSVVVRQSYDQTKIEIDAKELKLINDIASLFRESRGQSSEQSLVKSVLLVAEHMNFVHAQLYLYNPELNELIPQISNGENLNVPLSNNDNPFVSVFKSGPGKVINMEESRKADPYFKHDTALVLPLISEGERLGVIGLWQRQSKQTPSKAQDRELGLTIAGHLSNVIRAETAVLQIKADQARADLINRVSSEIRQSLKEVDQIMATLVTSLKEHFGLSRCLVSLYDHTNSQFTKFKSDPIINLANQDNTLEKLPPEYLELQLFNSHLEALKKGNTVFLDQQSLNDLIKIQNDQHLEDVKGATLVPLFYGGEFKAALCLLHHKQFHSLPKNDMHMVDDLANRVAAVIAHAELFSQVERQAITDPMTGLFNRRYFQDQLTKEIDRYQRFGHPFSFIIADLDFLKKINDTYGHSSGDEAIKHIANVMKYSVRDVDTVGRFGGEEFVVLLPETELRQARVVAERICVAIAETPVKGIGTITASLGLATFPNDAMDSNKLFELADKALFLAKDRGRNQVCSVSEDLIPNLSVEELPLIPTTPLRQSKQNIPAQTISSVMSPAGSVSLANAMAMTSPDTSLTANNDILDLTLIAQRGLLGLLSLIIKAIEELDTYEPARTQRVYNYTRQLARGLDLPEDRAEVIALAAVYSNLGKLMLPKDILRIILLLALAF
jgi:diguanylate cyclase (GGDEF)-like protein